MGMEMASPGLVSRSSGVLSWGAAKTAAARNEAATAHRITHTLMGSFSQDTPVRRDAQKAAPDRVRCRRRKEPRGFAPERARYGAREVGRAHLHGLSCQRSDIRPRGGRMGSVRGL